VNVVLSKTKDFFVQRKTSILLIFLLALVSLFLRIPVMKGPVNTDVWYLVWESRLLFEGHIKELIIHPLSIFGMYTFSPYPFGSLLAYRFFDLISFRHVFAGVSLFISFFVVLMAVFSFKFFKYILTQNEDKEEPKNNFLAFVGSLIYINFPYMIYFSYNFASARLPMMAFFPLFLMYTLQTIRKRSAIAYLKSIGIFIVLTLFHRMSIPLLSIVVLLGVYLVFFKLLANKLRIEEKIPRIKIIISKYFLLIFLLSVLISIILSFVLKIVTDPAGLTASSFFQTLLLQLQIVFADVMLEGWGPLIFFSLLGIIFLNTKFTVKDSSYYNILYLILLQLPLFLFISNNYSIYVLCIVPILLFLYYFKTSTTDNEKRKIEFSSLTLIALGVYFIIGIVLFSYTAYPISFYLYFFVIIGSFLIIFGVTLFFTKRYYDKKELDSIKLTNFYKQSTKIVPLILVVGLMAYSRFYLDAQTIFKPKTYPEYFPSIVLTEEEVVIADYLDQNQGSLFGCSVRLAGIRISVLSGCYYLADAHGLSLMLTGYYSAEDVRQNTTFRPFYKAWDFSFFEVEDSLRSGRSFYTDLVSNSINSTTLDIITQLDLKYFITLRNSTLVETRMTDFIESPFVQDIDTIATLILETEHYSLWEF